MPLSDVFIVFQWWSVLFLIGASAYPLTKQLFFRWYDQGYFFAKAVGFAVVSYIIYVVGTLHIAPFTNWTIYGAMLLLFVGGALPHLLQKKQLQSAQHRSFLQLFVDITNTWDTLFWDKGIIFLIEECLFFAALLFWTWIKAHEPSIQGLEKFMDYGFMQSILNSRYFPAADMWWAGGSINYYYFGHLVTAVLTKLSGLSLGYTFNLMLNTLFALTATMSFSIGYQITKKKLFGGILTALLVTMSGNMQTLYAFTKGYTGEDVQPFWHLLWPVGTFFQNLGTGMTTYWYANATRFIPFSIHEFPSYSFVVSDVHGHVLSLPFVLLAIALLLMLFVYGKRVEQGKHLFVSWGTLIFYGFLLGVLLMTNALDGPIYGILFALGWFVVVVWPQKYRWKEVWWECTYPVFLVVLLTFATALPFLFFFSSFATGIGVNCPPAALANTKIGPFLFEEVEKCQHSPLWMMWLLWGFFWFTGAWLFVVRIWKKEEQNTLVVRILKVFFLFSIGLIIFPEFLYVKDIYPAHFRSNTMFKLGYQAFIMWSIITGFVTTHMLSMKKNTIFRTLFFVLFIPQLFLVSIYPIFSVRSYFGNLETYKEIWGLDWIARDFPDDWNAINWLQDHAGPTVAQGDVPVIVEAAGDSYTNYNHISAFTGFPTITGWAVHEWLWRGTFETVAPRQEEVRKIYESIDSTEVSTILTTYHVRYIIVGQLEREKYSDIQESTLDILGSRVYTSGTTTIWEVSKR